MAKQPRNTRKPAAPALVEGVQPFANGAEIGNEIGGISQNASAVALRMRATLGNAYDITVGMPSFKQLGECIETYGLNFTLEGIRGGLAGRWDSMHFGAAPLDAALSAKYKRLLDRAGVESARAFAALSPQGKAALGKGDEGKRDAVKELTNTLNRFYSNSWGTMMRADDTLAGRVKARGRKDSSDIESILKNTPVKMIPEKIIALMKENNEIPDWWKKLAAVITKAGKSNATK